MKEASNKKILLFLIVILVFLTCCGDGQGDKIAAPGVVDGDIITVKSQAAGIVEQFLFKEGEKVEKGALIAKINSDKVENQVKELEIAKKEIEINRAKLIKKRTLVKKNLEYLGKQAQRFKRLEKSRSLAGEKVENMELKLLEAETAAFDLEKGLAALDVQEERIANKKEYLELILKDHRIAAPSAGVIIEKFVSAGENVFPNSAVVDILDYSSLYVEVFIEEGEIAALKLGRSASILVDGMEGKPIAGVISYFGRKAEFSPKYIVSEKERKALLYRVKVKVDDNDALKVGMPVTVEFKTNIE
ncbi:MAG: efflux RND transporter periplasmic adaptor subunit [Candidatus Aminicenantes bacterium]|nr:efflux RND transporter periplasmic adaptor subunit [Candidatus Aminicenantes bacterium]